MSSFYIQELLLYFVFTIKYVATDVKNKNKSPLEAGKTDFFYNRNKKKKMGKVKNFRYG